MQLPYFSALGAAIRGLIGITSPAALHGTFQSAALLTAAWLIQENA